jgi:tRNA 2-selenouridine synthase
VILSIQDFFTLRHSLPVVDVRTPAEFKAGHILHALNIPLLTDSERVAVGTDYKQKGQLEAIKTGFRLVGPRLEEIINQALAVGDEMIVHCWRGGMRSSNFCQFVGMAGIKTHQLEGGYKAYRNEVHASFSKPFHFIVVGGCTGSGKSEILQELKRSGEQVIDLESLASHKGSVFGGLMQPPQPTTEQFENNLFEEILQLDPLKRVWIEDESIAVGKIFLPSALWKQMSSSLVFEIELDKTRRVERLVNEYGKADPALFLDAMEKIVKKLGGQHFKSAKEKFLAGDMHSTIDILLTYYDKAYQAGLLKKNGRIKATLEWNGASLAEITNQLKAVLKY